MKMPKKYVTNYGIEHYSLDFTKEFNKCVISSFIKSYQNAETPNPCIECNKFLKFNLFYKKALELGCKYIATGHYAKIEYSSKFGGNVLKIANSLEKDQSYVLYNIPKEILGNVLFPLGIFKNKEEIRKIAQEHNLKIANKPDSQDICFIPDNNYAEFVLKNTNQKPVSGNIVNKDGIILGKHTGLLNYTIGQRKGLGISNSTPLYVIELNKEKNEVIVGEEKEIFKSELLATNLNYTVDIDLTIPVDIKAKIRYSAKLAEAKLKKIDDNIVKLVFDIPQRAITKGQSVVFYIDDVVIGGGKII